MAGREAPIRNGLSLLPAARRNEWASSRPMDYRDECDRRADRRGNPAKDLFVSQFMVGLVKMKKRSRTPVRASPMSLPKLAQMLQYLKDNYPANSTYRLWFSAVTALCFFGMCRISEVLMLKKGNVQLGLSRARIDGMGCIVYGAFVLKDRKTGSDPSAGRTYHMHHLPTEE